LWACCLGCISRACLDQVQTGTRVFRRSRIYLYLSLNMNFTQKAPSPEQYSSVLSVYRYFYLLSPGSDRCHWQIMMASIAPSVAFDSRARQLRHLDRLRARPVFMKIAFTLGLRATRRLKQPAAGARRLRSATKSQPLDERTLLRMASTPKVASTRFGAAAAAAPWTLVIAPDADLVAVMPVDAVQVTPVAPPKADMML
jgi:hypothetical protein